MPGSSFNPNNIEHRNWLASQIEQSVAESQALSVFHGQSVPAVPGDFDIVDLNALRDLLAGESGLTEEARDIAANLWGHFFGVDQYVDEKVQAPEIPSFKVGPFWTPLDPQGLMGNQSNKNVHKQPDSLINNMVSDRQGSKQIVSSQGGETSIEDESRYQGRSYETSIKRTLRTALDRLSKPTAHRWGDQKLSEFSSLINGKALWRTNLRYIELAIEALEAGYIKWPVSPRPQASSITKARDMIQWLKSLQSTLKLQDLIDQRAPTVVASDLFIQKVHVDLTDEELLHIEQVLEDLTLLVEQGELTESAGLLSELEAWWQAYSNSESRTFYPPRLGEAEVIIAKWKQGALTINLQKRQAIHPSNLDHAILEESAYILRWQLEGEDASLTDTLQQLSPELARSFADSIEVLEDFASGDPSIDEWKKWVSEHPELSTIVLVLAENSHSPHAQLILHETSPHVSEWTLAKLSQLQASTFGTELWNAKAIKGQATSLYAASSDLDYQRVQARAIELLSQPKLMNAFERAAIPAEDALQMLEEAIVELGHWPSASELSQAGAGLSLQDTQAEKVASALSIAEVLKSDSFFDDTKMSQDQWSKLIEAWKQRTNPQLWISEHNAQLLKVLTTILATESMVEVVDPIALKSVIETLKNPSEADSTRLGEGLYEQVDQVDRSLQVVMQRRLESIRQKKISRLQHAWDLYENTLGHVRTHGKSHLKLMRAQRFVKALEELWQVEYQEKINYDFRTWLQGITVNSELEQKLEVELKNLLGNSMSYRSLRVAIAHSISSSDLRISGVISESSETVIAREKYPTRLTRDRVTEHRTREVGRVRTRIGTEADPHAKSPRAQRLGAARQRAAQRVRFEITGGVK